MKYRKLRIAWSVAWGILCLLLVVLWVRSYPTGTTIADFETNKHIYDVESNNGWLILWRRERVLGMMEVRYTLPLSLNAARFGVEYGSNDLSAAVGFSFRLLVLLSVLSAAASWLPNRFSLRLLLIGMTVAAIGLGWVVYVIRQ